MRVTDCYLSPVTEIVENENILNDFSDARIRGAWIRRSVAIQNLTPLASYFESAAYPSSSQAGSSISLASKGGITKTLSSLTRQFTLSLVSQLISFKAVYIIFQC